MQIENTSLLSMQNTYMTKEIAVSSQTNQALPENERSSSIPDAGPAAVFEKGGTTNGMTGSVGVSRTTPMGSAGMLYAAGIMPMALEEDALVAQENSVPDTGIQNIPSNVATLTDNVKGTIKGATWSAMINPDEIRDGFVISINGIKFEFDTENNVNNTNSTHQGTTRVDISNAGAPGSAGYASAVVTAFADAVNAKATEIAKAVCGKELPSTAVNPGISYSWIENTDGATSQWKLTLTQTPDWNVVQTGNAFEVEMGKFLNNTDNTISQEGVPEIKDITTEEAKVTPAYLEYTVNTDELKHGDYFRFRDMCFIFAEPDKTKPEITFGDGDKVNPVYVDMSRGSATDTETFANKIGATFKNTFETYFAPSTSGAAPSRGGSDSSSMQYSSHNHLPRYNNPGKFNIEISTLLDANSGKWLMKIKIIAASPELLKKITLADNEGWGRSVESEEPAQPGEGTESTNPEEGTQGDTGESTASVPDSSAPTDSSHPAASSQSETDNVSSAESNGNNEPNKVEDAEVVSVNNTENTDNKIEGAESADAETSGTETQETSEPTTTEEKDKTSGAQETLDSED